MNSKKVLKGILSLAVSCMLLPAASHAQWSTGSGVIYTTVSTDRLGLGTSNPQDRLHIQSTGTNWPFASMRISNEQAGSCNATAFMAIAHGFGSFSNLATQGDLVINTLDNSLDPTIGTCAEDVILSTRTTNGSLRFGTSITAGTDVERMTITPGGNVGIGTTAPDSRLQIDGDTRIGVIRNINNGLPGYGDRLRFSGGPDNASWDSENTDALWMARYNVGSNVSELRVAIGDDTVNAANYDSFSIGIEFPGWVPRFQFRSDGTAFRPGGGTWTTFSDARLKENVAPFTDGLSVVRGINPVWFNYQAKYIPGSQRYVGVIAQDIQKVAPYTISESKMSIPDSQEQMDVLAYDPNAVTYIALNAIKELDAKVTELETLKEEVVALKTENEQIKQRLAALETQMSSSGHIAPLPFEDILLEQNNPNPFSESTTIMYFIPSEVAGTIEVVVADASGSKVLQRYPATANTPQQLTITAKGLDAGVYVYGVAVNGQIVKTKKMMILK